MRPEEDIEGELKREEKILKEMNVKGAFYSEKPELADIENEDDIVYNFEDDEPPAKKRARIEEPKENKEESQEEESDDESEEEAEEASETEEKIETVRVC